MRALALGLVCLLGACATQVEDTETGHPAVAPDSLDVIARDYVMLTLDIGELEPGYVDAYYGPAEWQAAAKAETETAAQLTQRADYLAARIAGLDRSGPADAANAQLSQRRKYLAAHVDAARARLRMIAGEKMSFADEAEALFGIRPEIRPLSAFDPVLAQMDALVPGPGPLVDRITAFKAAFVIPKDRIEPVMQAAIAECRARTVRHITLPADESFTLTLVNDKPWSGYNYYEGGAVSRIEINTDFPIYTERAIDLGCHEGYPGHHVYNALLEQTFVRDRGWVEMSVYPLFSPMSFVAEGSANYGIDLAFPGDEAEAFERDVLMPLAGLAPADLARKNEILRLTQQLARAEYVIADDYLAGRIDRDQAAALISKYLVTQPDKAAQRVRFIDTYRSYIINYGLGRDTVQAWVEAQDADGGSDHWAAMERLLSSQILPVDIIE